MKFDSINDIEDYIRDIIGIPYVNLEGIDLEVCNELLDTLEEVFSLYPLLKKSICAIGQSEYIEEQINLSFNSMDMEIDCDLRHFVWSEYTPILEKHDMAEVDHQSENNNPLYIALNIGPLISRYHLDYINRIHMQGALSGFNPPHSTTFKSTIYHELGHVLDAILKITEKKEFLELLQTVDIENEISRYATTNEREAFAEAFAEYHSTDEPNDAVRKIVEFGLEEYRRRAEKKSEIFDVSRKFR